jgi:hypothetical protein
MWYLLISLGLGLYLESIHPEMTWQTHLQHVIVFCTVHFNRNIDNSAHSSTIKQKMRSLLHQRSAEACTDLLREIERLGARDWVRNKRRSYILAGLNKYCSLMDPEHWAVADRNTNHTEAGHAQMNRLGTGLTLLRAIRK